MSRTPASFTQADVARVIRAAKQAGADTVEIKIGDTTAIVHLNTKFSIDVEPRIIL